MGLASADESVPVDVSSPVGDSGTSGTGAGGATVSDAVYDPATEEDTGLTSILAVDGAVIEISSPADLEKLSEFPTADFVFTSDIDATGFTGNPNGTFAGKIDGAGFKLYGLDSNQPLFNHMTNVTLQNLQIELPSKTAGFDAVLANNVTTSIIDNVTVRGNGLTVVYDMTANNKGLLFNAVNTSHISNLTFDTPTITIQGDSMEFSVFAGSVSDSTVTGLNFGTVTLDRQGNNQYEMGLFAKSVDDTHFSNVTGDIHMTGFDNLYVFGILMSKATGNSTVQNANLALYLDGVRYTYGVGVVAGSGEPDNTSLTVSDSVLNLQAVTPNMEVRRTSSVTGEVVETNVYNSTLTYHIPNAYRIQNATGVAGNVGTIQGTKVTADVVTGDVFIWFGGADTIKHSVNTEYDIDFKATGDIFTVGGVAQNLEKLEGGTVNTRLDYAIKSNQRVNFSYGVSQYTGEVNNVDIVSNTKVRDVPGATSTSAIFIIGLFGSGTLMSTLDAVRADVTLDVDVPSAENYSGYSVIGQSSASVVNSDITAKGIIKSTSLQQVNAFMNIGRMERNKINYTLDMENTGSTFLNRPFGDVDALEDNEITVQQNMKATRVDLPRGLALSLKNSLRNTYQVGLNIEADSVSDTMLLASTFDGMFDNDVANMDVNITADTSDRVHVFPGVPASASIQESEFNITGALHAQTPYWGYSLFSGIDPDAIIRKVAVYKDFEIDPQVSTDRTSSDFVRGGGDGAKLREVAYYSKQAPLIADPSIYPDDDSMYVDGINYEDSYLLFGTRGDFAYDTYSPASNFVRSYVRYLDTNEGMLLDAVKTPISDTLDMNAYPGYDGGWWSKQATDGIDSPRLTWQMDKEPQFTPSGSFKDDKVALTWTGGLSTDEVVAWEEGVRSSVVSAATSPTEFEVPVATQDIHRYKVARVGKWGVAVPKNEYVYDPSKVVVPEPEPPVTPEPEPEPTKPPVTPPVVPAPNPAPTTPSEPLPSPAPAPVTPTVPVVPVVPVEPPVVVPTPPYPDVRPGSFYEPAVTALKERGVIKGVPAGGFQPDREVTRVEFALMVKRAMGYPGGTEYQGGFDDLNPSAWYMEELADALNTGVTKGFTDRTYRPNVLIPREQAAIMLSNILRHNSLGTGVADLSFDDQDKIIAWAKDDLMLTVEKGIIQGYPDHTVRPKDHLTRGEAAVLIYRLLVVLDQL